MSAGINLLGDINPQDPNQIKKILDRLDALEKGLRELPDQLPPQPGIASATRRGLMPKEYAAKVAAQATITGVAPPITLAAGILGAQPATTTDPGSMSAAQVAALNAATAQLAALPLVPPQVQARHSVNQAFANGAVAPFVLDTEDFDTGGMHSTTTNTNRLTCVTTGLYSVLLTVAWAFSPTGSRLIGVRNNGGVVLAADWRLAVGDGETIQQVSWVGRLTAGDWIEGYGRQSSGGALNALATFPYSVRFQATRIGGF